MSDDIGLLLHNIYEYTLEGCQAMYKDAWGSLDKETNLGISECKLFIKELYNRCCPVAKTQDIGPVRLAYIASQVAVAFEREGYYNRLAIVNFVYRMLMIGKEK